MIGVQEYYYRLEMDTDKLINTIIDYKQCFIDLLASVRQYRDNLSRVALDINIILSSCYGRYRSSIIEFTSIVNSSYFGKLEYYDRETAETVRRVVEYIDESSQMVEAISELLISVARMRIGVMARSSQEVVNSIFSDLRDALAANNIYVFKPDHLLLYDNLSRVSSLVSDILDGMIDILDAVFVRVKKRKIDRLKRGARLLRGRS